MGCFVSQYSDDLTYPTPIFTYIKWWYITTACRRDEVNSLRPGWIICFYEKNIKRLCSIKYCYPGMLMSCELYIRAGVKYVLSNTNTNTNIFFSEFQIQIQIHRQKFDQIQIQIQIQSIKYKYKYIVRTAADTKLPPFYRWHIQIHSIVRKLFYLFKFHWIVSKSPIYNEPALIQIMAWHWVCNKPLSDQ